jgi:phage terminase large subunit
MAAPALPKIDALRESPKISAPQFRGAALDLMGAADTEVCLDGPAGTGKSYAALWKMHMRRILFPGSRGLLARKTLISLKSSTLVTYKQQVLGPLLALGYVRFWSAKGDEPAHYAYWNGSKQVIVGLDKPGKAMSTEYDDILIDEALDTEEEDIETLLTRIQRPGHEYGVEGRPPYAQLTLVTNPGHPTHWLNQRMNAGRTRRLISRHEDNPKVTPEYLALLQNSLTGARYDRLFLGRWVSAEGIVYDEWDPAVHLIKRFEIPREWPRYIVIDFGFTNPCCIQWWAMDPDGRLYRYRELYMTKRTVDEHAAKVKAISANDPLPRAVIADPEDADGRAVFSRVTGWSTLPAHKDIENGIQAVKARMRDAGDGKPRIFFLQDSLIERDQDLAGRKLPTCSEEEIESYVWATNAAGIKETPVDANNHGQDCLRYLVAHFDLADRRVQSVRIPW